MKKRCTNSACRKEFTLQPGTAMCPHCGKRYPRHFSVPHQWKDVRPHRAGKTAMVKNRTFAVVLTGWQGTNRLSIVRFIREQNGCGLRDAIAATKRPTVIGRQMRWETAEALALGLEREGGTVAIVPSDEAANHGALLPWPIPQK